MCTFRCLSASMLARILPYNVVVLNQLHFNYCNYHPQTKLREDDVFTHVCLFTGGYIPAFTWAGGVNPIIHLGRGCGQEMRVDG